MNMKNQGIAQVSIIIGILITILSLGTGVGLRSFLDVKETPEMISNNISTVSLDQQKDLEKEIDILPPREDLTVEIKNESIKKELKNIQVLVEMNYSPTDGYGFLPSSGSVLNGINSSNISLNNSVKAIIENGGQFVKLLRSVSPSDGYYVFWSALSGTSTEYFCLDSSTGFTQYTFNKEPSLTDKVCPESSRIIKPNTSTPRIIESSCAQITDDQNKKKDCEMQKRDSKRISDLAAVNSLISLYMLEKTNPQLAPDIQENVCGVNYWGSVRGSKSNFNGNKIQGTITGTGIDGTGWVPINFDAIKSGSPLSKLPVDPINSPEFSYTYSCDNNSKTFELNANFESSNFIEYAKSDDGDRPNIFEVGSDLSL